MKKEPLAHEIPHPTAHDLDRIRKLLFHVGGPQVSWGAKACLDVWAIEQRAKLDQQISARIRNASWALVGVTLALTLCTGGLIWATIAG